MKTPLHSRISRSSLSLGASSSFSEAHPSAVVWEPAREQEEQLAAGPPGEEALPEEAPSGEAELHAAHSHLDPVGEPGAPDD